MTRGWWSVGRIVLKGSSHARFRRFSESSRWTWSRSSIREALVLVRRVGLRRDHGGGLAGGKSVWSAGSRL